MDKAEVITKLKKYNSFVYATKDKSSIKSLALKIDQVQDFLTGHLRVNVIELLGLSV